MIIIIYYGEQDVSHLAALNGNPKKYAVQGQLLRKAYALNAANQWPFEVLPHALPCNFLRYLVTLYATLQPFYATVYAFT